MPCKQSSHTRLSTCQKLNLPARNLLWWMQREESSPLLFRIDPFSAFKMYSFSLLHKLHCFPPDLYHSTCFTMSHLMLYSLFFSFKDHTYFDSSVIVAYKGLVMDFLWFPNRSLNVVDVLPM